VSGNEEQMENKATGTSFWPAAPWATSSFSSSRAACTVPFSRRTIWSSPN